METVHEEMYKGYSIKIYPDNDGESPREWDNLGTMVCFYRRYNLGDKNNFHSSSDVQSHIETSNAIALDVYMYDHSGITINTTGFSCPWDSGQVGVIYVDLDKVRKEYGWKHITKERRKKIEQYLRNEVEVYDDYLTGNVYGYVIEDQQGGHVDSCWGFYPDRGDNRGYSYCLKEAQSSADWYAVERYNDEVDSRSLALAAI